MRDIIYIGSSPADEPCAQVGEDGYTTRAKRECRALINQLIRLHGEPPDGAMLITKSCGHDFGTYHEVVCYVDNDEAISYALKCEDLPEKWDQEAIEELSK